MNRDSELVIAVIGAGGIGSNLMSVLYPALQQGNLVESCLLYTSDAADE